MQYAYPISPEKSMNIFRLPALEHEIGLYHLYYNANIIPCKSQYDKYIYDLRTSHSLSLSKIAQEPNTRPR